MKPTKLYISPHFDDVVFSCAGKIIDDLSKEGNKNKFNFPIGLSGSNNAKMSFSGVKTSLKTFIEKNEDNLKDPIFFNDTCASYQEAIVQAIKEKTTTY